MIYFKDYLNNFSKSLPFSAHWLTEGGGVGGKTPKKANYRGFDSLLSTSSIFQPSLSLCRSRAGPGKSTSYIRSIA